MGVKLSRIWRIACALPALIAALSLAAAVPVAAQQNNVPATSAVEGEAARRALDDLRLGSQVLADLAEDLLDTVVNISTSQTVNGSGAIPMPEVPEGSPYKEFFEEFFERQRRGGTQRKVRSLGSGFVIDSSGIIVTNNHVISEADEIIANFSDGTELDAELVGRDPTTDIAVLRVNPQRPLKAAKFGNSGTLRVGNWVMAIGNPFGLGGSVTVGVVSARNRDIQAGPYDDFIQTDASINRGNSGGPLFNLDGEVVGINTAIFSPTGGSIGIGFAVPSNLARPIVQQLVETGEVQRGWLGVRIQEVDEDTAKTNGLERPRGALILGVNPDGPAAAAGVETGDIVVAFDGVDIHLMRNLPRSVAAAEPGKEVDVTVIRDGEEVTVRVKVGRLGSDTEDEGQEGTDGEESVTGDDELLLGLELGPMSEKLRDEYGISDDLEGVVVLAVEEGSDAQERGIVPGNVIVKVGQQAVATPEDVAREIAALRKQGRDWIVFALADANGDTRFVAVNSSK